MGKWSEVPYFKLAIHINKRELLGYMLAIYFLFLPFSQVAIVPGVSVLRVISILPFIASITRICKGLHARFFAEYIFLIIMSLWAICTSFLSVASNLSGFVSLVSNFFFIGYFSLFVYSNHEYNLLCKADTISAWIASLSIIYGLITGGFMNSGRGGIVFLNQEIDPNFSCGYLVYAISYYTTSFLESKKKRFVFLSLILICISLITGSRGGLMSTAGTFFVVLFLYFFKKKNFKLLIRMVFLFLLLGVAFVIFVNLLPPALSSRYSIESVVESRGTGRIDIWIEVLNKFMHFDLIRILLGNGIGASSYFSSTGHVAHNTWLEYLVSFGVLGSCVFLFFYAYVFFSAYRNGRIELASAIAGYYVLQLSLSAYTYRPLFNAILLLIIFKRNSRLPLKLPA